MQKVVKILYHNKIYTSTSVCPGHSPGHNIDLRLLHHQGLLWQYQACLLSDGTSARPNGVTTLL